MKYFFSFYVLFFCCVVNIVTAQAPSWKWARGAGGIGSSGDAGEAIAVDLSGNIFVTGNFSSTTINFGNITLTNPGNTNSFIVKYDPSGNVIWAKSAGIHSYESVYPRGICTDANGNVYVAGLFDYDTITIDNITLINNGIGGDIFIVKYDSSGNVLWAKRAGGNGDDGGGYIANDGIGNIYITGWFKSPEIIFDSATFLITTNSSPVNGTDIFIAKYDSLGNVLWAVGAGGRDKHDEGSSITTDANGNIYVAGNFDSDSITFGSTTLTHAAAENTFIAKYDPLGNAIWAKAGGPYGAGTGGISTDTFGNVYMTGYFTGNSIVFGGITLINANNNYDLYIVKYDSSGNVLWAKSAGGEGSDYANDLISDVNGNVYITGMFASDSITFGNITLTLAGGANIFVVKYDASGNAIWAKEPGEADYAGGNGICTDVNGNIYITGEYRSQSIALGRDTLLDPGYMSPGATSAVFVAKLGQIATVNTGIKNTTDTSALIAPYPNPTTGTICFKGTSAGYTIEVYDILGQMVHSSIAAGDNVSINLAGQAKGMYFYRVSDKTGVVQTGKVLVE